MASPIVQISNKAEHDDTVAQSKDTPTVIHVSNSVLPACKSFNPKYEELAQNWSSKGVRFCQLEFTEKTSMMFKFAPNQLPVTVLMVHDRWCRTVMGPDLGGMKKVLEELVQEAKKPVDG